MTAQIAPQTARATFLSRVLRGNAVFSGLSGVVLILGAAPLATLFGLDAPVAFLVVGVGILVFAISLFGAAAHDPVSRRFVLAVAMMDTAWVLVSAVGLLAGWFPVTTEGKWIILFVADIVAVFAALEFYGLWRTRAG